MTVALALLGAGEPSLSWFVVPALLGAVLVAGTRRARSERRVRALEVALHEQRQIARAAQKERLALADARRRLIASISHELRTPLTSIKGYAEILRSQRLGPLTERQERALAVMSRAVRREEALVENLVCFALLESGRYVVARETCDPRDAARATVDGLLPVAGRRGLELALRAPREPVAVAADRAGVGTVLTNLVENALKFTPAGGRVELSVAAAAGRATVSVEDTGGGIPASDRARVFAPFFVADGGDTREHGGAGLGLPIVKGILDAHGVGIDLDERPGGGARFRFSLPLVRQAVAA